MKDREDLKTDFLDLFDTDLVPKWLLRLLPFQFVPLYHLPRVLSYDYVIASDAFLLASTVAFCNWFRARKTKWIFVAINILVMVRRHKSNTLRNAFLRHSWKTMWHIAYLARDQKDVLRSVGIPDSKLTYMPLGIDLDFFKDAKGDGQGSYVLSVGRDQGRDFETFFAAAALLPYQFIVATSPKNIPKGSVIPPNVAIKYDITINDIKELYRGARIVCLVLKGEDTVEGSDCTGQTVILESFGASQAVAMSDRAWLRSYFTAGEDYLPMPIGDPQAVANHIRELWQDDAARLRLSQRGNETANKLYRTEGMAEVILQILSRDGAIKEPV
ncbi:MAG: hypothetical protein V4644_03280 [Patescibacteria group bacterium]